MDFANILLVDDEVSVLDGYRRSLQKQFRLDTASSGREAIELLSNNPPYAVIISDMRMPNMTGLELLSRVRELSPDTIPIMLTGNSDQQTVVDAVNQGEVYKFLCKPCESNTLAAAIKDGVERYNQAKSNRILLERNVSKVKNLTQRLSYQALHDSLTGLDNRKSFEIRLDNALESAQNDRLIHAVCYLDVDHFHIINESYGIAAGDRLLRRLAQLLRSGRRKADMVARLASDKFGILLDDCNLEEARKIIQLLHQQLNDFSIECNNKKISISASIGLAPITSEDESVTTIIKTAEAACNLAKEKGINLLHVADPDDQDLQKRLREVMMATDITRALEENRFQLYYQTIAPIRPDKTDSKHYELLLRMLNTDGTIRPPNDFLPAAERYHLAPRIDCWVIRNAVDWLSAHPSHLEKLSTCAINLSGLSIGNSEVLDCITKTFESSPVSPNKICFEITETAAITKLDAAMEFFTALKASGFQFSLDDFGSGYSSFAYLRNLPIDYLKIDGMFVKNMDSDAINRSVVKSIHEIAQTMGIKTVAEFVENKEIYRCLEEIQVDYAQGYLIARPSPLDDME
jgi:diguanylate cyclase (GGDEF)-like protein